MKSGKSKTNLEEWYLIVKPILSTSEFQKRKYYKHHGKTTVYEHSISVSLGAFIFAKKYGFNSSDAAIAGLLHDFYKKPWMDKHEKLPLFKRHGFTHARDALSNAQKNYSTYLNKNIENAILRHMFPLNIIPPTSITGWIVTYIDKKVSMDFFKEPDCILKTFGLSMKG